MEDWSTCMWRLTSKVRLALEWTSVRRVTGMLEVAAAACLCFHVFSRLEGSPQKTAGPVTCSERSQPPVVQDPHPPEWAAAEEHYKRAEQFGSAGDLRSAEDELRAAVAQVPKADKYVRRLALFEIERQRYDDAIGIIREYVNLCGPTALGWALEAELLFKQRQFDAAYEAAQNSCRLFKDDARMHEVLGLVCIAKRQNAAAAIELEKAAALDPENPRIRYFCGRTLYSTGRHREARDHFLACLKAQPQYPRALENLGLCYEALTDFPKASDCYRKAIALEEAEKGRKHGEPYAYYGRLLLQIGDSAEALAVLRRGVALVPRSFIASFELGRALLTVGQLEDAEHFLMAAKNLDPKFARTYYLLGRLCQSQKRPNEAAQYWATFERLNQNAENREIPLTD